MCIHQLKITPNCTLVELKYDPLTSPTLYDIDSKLYLSGIEIGSGVKGF